MEIKKGKEEKSFLLMHEIGWDKSFVFFCKSVSNKYCYFCGHHYVTVSKSLSISRFFRQIQRTACRDERHVASLFLPSAVVRMRSASCPWLGFHFVVPVEGYCHLAMM